jgi:hypothetical protein
MQLSQLSQNLDCTHRPGNASPSESPDSDAMLSINVRSMAKKHIRPDCGGVRANIH